MKWNLFETKNAKTSALKIHQTFIVVRWRCVLLNTEKNFRPTVCPFIYPHVCPYNATQEPRRVLGRLWRAARIDNLSNRTSESLDPPTPSLEPSESKMINKNIISTICCHENTIYPTKPPCSISFKILLHRGLSSLTPQGAMTRWPTRRFSPLFCCPPFYSPKIEESPSLFREPQRSFWPFARPTRPSTHSAHLAHSNLSV